MGGGLTLRGSLEASAELLYVPWCIIGGLAVAARTSSRVLTGVDIAVALPSNPASERLVRRFTAEGWQVAAAVEQAETDRLATVRLERGELRVSLVFAMTGIEQTIVTSARVLEPFPSLRAPVAAVGHLIAMKLLSRGDDRPGDQADLDALRKVASPEDLTVAREAVLAIEAAGAHRDKELAVELEALLTGGSGSQIGR